MYTPICKLNVLKIVTIFAKGKQSLKYVFQINLSGCFCNYVKTTEIVSRKASKDSY